VVRKKPAPKKVTHQTKRTTKYASKAKSKKWWKSLFLSNNVKFSSYFLGNIEFEFIKRYTNNRKEK
jgi:hypothetical protein